MARSKTTVRCISCGGIYDTVTDDGSEYYHVCPPDGAVQPVTGNRPAIVNPRDERRIAVGFSLSEDKMRETPVTQLKRGGQGTAPAVRPPNPQPPFNAS